MIIMFDNNFIGYIALAIFSAVGISLTYAAINFAQEKALLIQDEKVRKGVQRVIDAVGKAVNYTNQTFVDEMKREGSFTKESAKEAFIRTRDMAEKLIDEEGRRIIKESYNDFDTYIKAAIEEQVRYGKDLYQPPMVELKVQEECEDQSFEEPISKVVLPTEDAVKEADPFGSAGVHLEERQ